jgi:LPS sulfotransferase NodH
VSYLISSTQRSGSTWFSWLLEQTGVAGRPVQEHWNLGVEFEAHQKREFSTYLEYLAHVRHCSTTPNGVLGARIMWRQMPGALTRMRSIAGWADFGQLELWQHALPGLDKFVFTYREDVLTQAVSWAKAIQTRQFTSEDKGNGHRPRYKFWDIDTLHWDIHAHNLAWETWFAAHGVTPHRVKYEDVVTNPAARVLETLEFLGIRRPSQHLELELRFKIQRNRLNDRWRVRWLTEAAARHIQPQVYKPA